MFIAQFMLCACKAPVDGCDRHGTLCNRDVIEAILSLSIPVLIHSCHSNPTQCIEGYKYIYINSLLHVISYCTMFTMYIYIYGTALPAPPPPMVMGQTSTPPPPVVVVLWLGCSGWFRVGLELV